MSVILESINIVFEKDFWGGVLASVSIAVSINALASLIRKWRKPKSLDQIIADMEKTIKKVRRDYERNKDDLTEAERIEAENQLSEYENLIKRYYDGTLVEYTNNTNNNKELGFISHDFLLYAVPAIIALTFTFTLVYLLVENQAVENYQSPEVLKSGLSTIIGYYFGVAVKNSPSSDSEHRLNVLQRQMENIVKN